MNSPKAFISYSWTSPVFQKQIREWAERLSADGIEVVLDQFDLREGQDKYSYMERMVTDPSVSHVLIFCDRLYAEKANNRKAGVGTESQIISKEIYDKVSQSKFVPVVCEFDDQGEPCIPTFAASRIWIDFSSEESVNQNWERLIRHLYGKPLFQKPTVGRPPAYITDETTAQSNVFSGKLEVFKNAFLANRRGIRTYRGDLLDLCIEFVDKSRVRKRIEILEDDIPLWVVERYRELIPARDVIIDWVRLESSEGPTEEFESVILEFLERLLELKERPEEVTSYSKFWYEPQGLFVYETLIYIVATLFKERAFEILNGVLTGNYLRPKQNYGSERFDSVTAFYKHTELIGPALTTEKIKYHSEAAELIKRNAQRSDIDFNTIKNADALIHLSTYIDSNTDWWWYPQTSYYNEFSSDLDWFVRGAQHRHFKNLATTLGVKNGSELRDRFQQKEEQEKGESWQRHRSFRRSLNIDELDTIQ